MKKVFVMFALAASMLSSTAMGQENRSFAEISVGTQAKEHTFMSGTVKAFHGANVSLEVGHDFNGLSASLYFGYFSNDWSGKNQASTHFHSNSNTQATPKAIYDQSIIRSADQLSSVTAFSVMANVSYDLLRFIKGNWRHHIRPRVGLGYSHFGASSFSYSTNSRELIPSSGISVITDTNVNNEKTSNSGFEWSLGIGYDFSITRDWSIGLQYEKFMRLRDQQLLGLRARYAF